SESSEFLSVATTWAPAPIAKSMSVAVGDNDTMCVGFWVRVMSPTVTGNAAAAADWDGVVVVLLDAQPETTNPARASAARASAGGFLMNDPPVGRGFGASPTGEVAPACEAPFLESANRDN